MSLEEEEIIIVKWGGHKQVDIKKEGILGYFKEDVLLAVDKYEEWVNRIFCKRKETCNGNCEECDINTMLEEFREVFGVKQE